MSNKLILHYVGGAGINISKDINTALSELGEGFCNVLPHYVDTSNNNIHGIDNPDLWRVKSTQFSGVDIDGSGGVRKTNAPAIADSIKEYLDHHNYKAPITGEFHIVLFSASGGTGSVASPLLICNLRERGIPVVGIMVGDSANGLSCENTLNTIATMDHMAKNTINKPVVMIYYNNHASVSVGRNKRESEVNKMIFNTLSILSLFLSGDNEDIDTKDMINFLCPELYTSLDIPASLYTINVYTGDTIDNDESVINLIGRTLTAVGQDSDVDVTLLQHKYGTVINPEAIRSSSDITPVHLILTGNHLVIEHQRLSTTAEEYSRIADAVKTIDLGGRGTADSSGMIL